MPLGSPADAEEPVGRGETARLVASTSGVPREAGLQVFDLHPQRLIGLGQIPELGLEPADLDLPTIGSPDLQRRLTGGQEGVAPNAQLGRRHHKRARQQLPGSS
jgi:hypothetical protein